MSQQLHLIYETMHIFEWIDDASWMHLLHRNEYDN